MEDQNISNIKGDDEKVSVAEDNPDSEHGVDEPLNPDSKRSSATDLSKDKKKKKEPFLAHVSLPFYSLRIGTVQFFLGVFLLLFGIAAVATNAGLTKYTFGIWVGVAGTCAGVLGVLLAQMRRRDLLLACLTTSISAIILSLVTLTAACIGISDDVPLRNEQKGKGTWLDRDDMVNYDARIAMNSILIILSIFEAIVASINVVFLSLFIQMAMKPKPGVVLPPEEEPAESAKEVSEGGKAKAPVVSRRCGCTVYQAYNGAVGLRCGILQLTFGILLLAFGTVNLALEGWGSEFAIAVWGSTFVIVAGSLGIHSATDKRRDILICCCFFSTISSAAVTGLFITAAVATKYDFPQLQNGKAVIQVILMIGSLAEFIVAVFQATFCMKAFPANAAHQYHHGQPGPAAAECSVVCANAPSYSAPSQGPAPQSNPMVILPLPGRSKDPFQINYGPARTGGYFVSVNEKVPYVDEDGMDTSVHYVDKEGSRAAANV